MRKLLPVITLLIGFACGWGVAAFFAHRNIEKIKSAWPPEVQLSVAEYMEFTGPLSSEDLEQFRRDIRDYKQQTITDLELKTLYDALLAGQIMSAHEQGDANQVQELLTDALAELKEAHAAGRYKGKEWERLADTLVSQMNDESPAVEDDEPEERLNSALDH